MNARAVSARFPIATARRALLAHYRAHARDLPWRREHDPYRILVSEVMLQQTQVVTVIDRYATFVSRFPTLERLARASDEEVCEAWAGLGYYRRARNLHAAAKIAWDRHAGRLPCTAAELATLPGLGRYTAGAVASIAFGEPTPAVDGNVTRVLTRALRIDAVPESSAGRVKIWAAAKQLMDGSRPGDLNQALMEVGALICRPRAPRCGSCPLRRHCAAHAAGAEEAYPRKAGARSARPELSMTLAWLEGRAGVWLERRPESTRWAGQWQLPSEEGRGARKRLGERLGLELDRKLGTVRHELTHRRVRATVFAARATRRMRAQRDFRPFPDFEAAPVSGLGRRAIAAVLAARRDA